MLSRPNTNQINRGSETENNGESETKSGWSNRKKATVGILALLATAGGGAAIAASMNKPHVSSSSNTPSSLNPTSTSASTISYCAGYETILGYFYMPVGITNTGSTPIGVRSYNFTSNVNQGGNPPLAWCYYDSRVACAFPEGSQLIVTPQGDNFLFQIKTPDDSAFCIPANTTAYVFSGMANNTPFFQGSNLILETEQGLFVRPTLTGNCSDTLAERTHMCTNMEKQQTAKAKRIEKQNIKKSIREAKKAIARDQLSKGPSLFNNPARWLAEHVPGFSSLVDKAVNATGKKNK